MVFSHVREGIAVPGRRFPAAGGEGHPGQLGDPERDHDGGEMASPFSSDFLVSFTNTSSNLELQKPKKRKNC